MFTYRIRFQQPYKCVWRAKRIAHITQTCALWFVVMFAFVICVDVTSISAQTGTKQLNALASKQIDLKSEAEVSLGIVARVRNGSWSQKGREAAALTISVDGVYSSDLLLWGGDEHHIYKVHLGRLTAGRHVVTVHFNSARSAPELQTSGAIDIKELQHAETTSLNSTSEMTNDVDANRIALAYSPILYARANTIDRFTDVPLLMYYEVLPANNNRSDVTDRAVRIRYSVIFSHEDGGTPTAALMARWGRTTDIEWVYEFVWRNNQITEETYQGVAHETKRFVGTRINGAHPLLAIASDNNNFSDLACSAVRFALVPQRAQLDAASREQIMDAAPWTYKIMAEELRREERIASAISGDARSIPDPRTYLYTEAYGEQQGATLAVEVRLKNDTQVYRSDLGDARLRIERSGFFRAATPLPPGTTPDKLATVTLRCHRAQTGAGAQECRAVKLVKTFLLRDNYTPAEINGAEHAPVSLSPNETFVQKFNQVNSSRR